MDYDWFFCDISRNECLLTQGNGISISYNGAYHLGVEASSCANLSFSLFLCALVHQYGLILCRRNLFLAPDWLLLDSMDSILGNHKNHMIRQEIIGNHSKSWKIYRNRRNQIQDFLKSRKSRKSYTPFQKVIHPSVLSTSKAWGTRLSQEAF